MSEASIQGHREISVGTLPAEWVATKLGDEVASIVGGGTPSKDVAEYWGGDIPWASVKDFSGSRLSRTQDYITQEAIKASATNLIPAGTLITPTRMALGRVAVFDCNVAINQDLKAIFPKPTLLRDFLFYWFQGNADRIEAAGTGSTVKGIRLEVLREFGLALPPLPEQQKIAAILSTVDDKLDVIARQIEATQTLKQGLMQTLFSRGVGTQDADGRWVPHAEFKDSELGEIPVDWTVAPLGELIEKLMDFRGRTPKKLGMDWGGGDIPALSANNVRMGYIDFDRECYLGSDELYAAWMVQGDTQKNDLVFTMEAPLGNVAVIPDDRKYILSQRVVLLRANQRVKHSYLFQYLRSDTFRKILEANSTGTTAKGIQQKRLVQLPVVVPPPEEQGRIADMLSAIDGKLGALQSKQSHHQTLKRGLMQKLLTGEWRVNVDPSATET